MAPVCYRRHARRVADPAQWRFYVKDYEPMMSFGEDHAEAYDDLQRFSKTPSRSEQAAAVAFLGDLAGGGPALELAIGTGWIALPLAASGIRVDGIDLSPAMVARLRAKPGGDRISVTIGDFAEVLVPGTYRLIFVVANSLFNLLTQEDQVRCFENVAAHLADDGSFVVEAFVPPISTACATTSMWMRKPSRSMRCAWMWLATIPWPRRSTRATCHFRARAYA